MEQKRQLYDWPCRQCSTWHQATRAPERKYGGTFCDDKCVTAWEKRCAAEERDARLWAAVRCALCGRRRDDHQRPRHRFVPLEVTPTGD